MTDRIDAPRKPRIAIVHDWLTVYGGGEKVLEKMLETWPEADLFSVVDFVPENLRFFLKGRTPKTTFIQRLPWAKTRYRSYLPLMPLAIEQLDLSAYDVVLSSSHAVAKGVITGPDQVHVSYVHSPIRYAWDLQHQYLAEAGLVKGLKSVVARLILHYMRLWDTRTANGVDVFVANSAFVARRLAKAYGRKAEVIHPPVDINRFALHEQKQDFYLTASRMVPYKKIPLIVQAFAGMPDKRLVVIGEGPEYDKVRAVATPNVEVLGYKSTPELIDHMQRAKAFVFAAEEDFGITPVEAQACGTPVIAYGKGGSLETVRGRREDECRTGVYFFDQSVQSIQAAVSEFEAHRSEITAQMCRRHAEDFAPENFQQRLKAVVDKAIQSFQRPDA